MGAAEGQSIKRDVHDRALATRRPLDSLRRPIACFGGRPLREQQVAVPIPLQRVEQGIVRLPIPLPPLGVGEEIRGLLPFAGGMERVALFRAVEHHLKCSTGAIRQRD